MQRACSAHPPSTSVGLVTWLFTETSIGIIARVSYGSEELDLTDYTSL